MASGNPSQLSDHSTISAKGAGVATQSTATDLKEQRAPKSYTNESGYAIDIDKTLKLFDTCGRGICLIHTESGATGTGALYELVAGAYALMTNHHVLHTTEVGEVFCPVDLKQVPSAPREHRMHSRPADDNA